MKAEATRPRCAYCAWRLTDNDLAGGLCPSCGQRIIPKEPQE